MLSTLTLYDASLVVLRLSGLLDLGNPGWLLLTAAFFVSGPGSWALAAQGVNPLRFLGGVTVLGGVGIVYSAALTRALDSGGVLEEAAVHVLAAATLLLLGAMEMLLVDDARRVMNGATRRCLAGIPLYIWPLIVLFSGLAFEAAVRGNPLPLLPVAAALLYSAASRSPGGSPACTAAATAAAGLLLGLVAFSDTGAALAAAAASLALGLAPYTPWALLSSPPSVVARLVALGSAAVLAAAPGAAGLEGLAEDILVYSLVAAAGWLLTAAVAAAARRSPVVIEAASSPVLRHAAGFALVIAGLHVLGRNIDPGLVILAAAAATAAVNQLARPRSPELQELLPGHPS